VLFQGAIYYAPHDIIESSGASSPNPEVIKSHTAAKKTDGSQWRHMWRM